MKDIYFVLEESGLKNLKEIEDEKIRAYLLEKVKHAEKCQQEYLENQDSMGLLEKIDTQSRCKLRLTHSKTTLALFDKIGKNQFLKDMFKELSYLNQFHILHEVIDFEELNNL